MKSSQLQFSLRSLFILTAFLCCIFAVLGKPFRDSLVEWRLHRREARIAEELKRRGIDAHARNGDWIWSVTCMSDHLASDEDLQLIGQLEHVENLQINNGSPKDQRMLITDTGLRSLSSLDLLSCLALRNVRVEEDGLSYILSTSLTDLLLENSSISDASAVHLPRFTQLKKLDLYNTDLGDRGVTYVCKMPSVTELVLRGTNITDAALPELAKMRGLLAIDLSCTKITDDGLGFLAALENLGDLDVSDTAITDAGFVSLMEDLPNLTSIDVSGTQLTDDTFCQLDKLENLYELRAARTNITDDALTSDAFRHITFLDLSSTAVTDNGLRRLALLWSPVEDSVRLARHLAMANTNITDAGLDHLKDIDALASLDVSGTQVTRAGKKRLFQAQGASCFFGRVFIRNPNWTSESP